jgi:hypothetical protein
MLDINLEVYATDLVMVNENSYFNSFSDEKYTHIIGKDKNIFVVHDSLNIEIAKTIHSLNTENTIIYFYNNCNSIPKDIIKALGKNVSIKFIPKEQIDNFNLAITSIKNKNNN